MNAITDPAVMSSPLEWEDAKVAAAAVLSDAPSITALGQLLAHTERAYEAFDTSTIERASKGHPQEFHCVFTAQDAQHVLYDRQEALRLLITTTPATTVGDAAVQTLQIIQLAGSLDASEHSDRDREWMVKRIERMALGMLPVLAKAAGLDMAAMGWADQDAGLRVARFAGVGVEE